MMGPEHDRNMSPEALSSLFQQRPMRPLPKRRLRERLSPDVADSIEYPPASQQSSPLFLYPNIVRDEPSPSPGRNYTVIRDQCYEDSSMIPSESGETDEDMVKRLSHNKSVRQDLASRMHSPPSKNSQSKQHPQPPPSTASSIDGYDSFENTNNKKKRKIPSAGDSGLNGIHSLNDLNSLSISTATSPSNDHDLAGGSATSPQHGSAGFVGSNQGISGPGRGRYGRSRNGRSPLRTLSDATNSLPGRGSKTRAPQWTESPTEPTGIISSAIANAEKITSVSGQENLMSLLRKAANDPEVNRAGRHASSQFTFTCDSQSPSTKWPGGEPAPRPFITKYSTFTTRETPEMSAKIAAANAAAAATANSGAATRGSTPRPTRKKKGGHHCRLDKEIRQTADDRRRDAQYKRRTNPPKPEDDWICPLCEYELIFGEPPRALIHQYEMKDRKIRRQEEERKRLLEKAKSKGRKTKKSGKPSTKAASPPPIDSHVHGGTHGSCRDRRSDSNTTEDEDEDYLGDIDRADEGSYHHDDPPMLLSDDPEADADDAAAQSHRHPPGCSCGGGLELRRVGPLVDPGSA